MQKSASADTSFVGDTICFSNAIEQLSDANSQLCNASMSLHGRDSVFWSVYRTKLIGPRSSRG